MADTPAEKPSAYSTMGQPAHEAPEVSSGRGDNLSVDLGIALPTGQTKPTVRREPDHGLETNIEGDKATLKKVDQTGETAAPAKVGADGQPAVVDPAAPVVPPVPDPATEAALPDFDAAVPATVEAYTKEFVSPDGKTLNMANLTADWQKSAKVDPKTGAITGNLSEGVYKFLDSKGIDKATVQQVEAGQVARLTLDRNAVFTQAGGQDKYLAATDWARKGGYAADATAKFNTDLNAGGQARTDAIDLLMQRYTKANPTPRQVSPTRTTADAASNTGAPAGGVQPYPNYKAWQADVRQARATNDQALLETSRARLKASPWHSGQK